MTKKKKYQDYHIFSVPIWGMIFKKNQLNEIKKWEEIIFRGSFGRQWVWVVYS